MNITPNTDLKVLHNVPLDNTYEHTIYFGPQGQASTLSAQSTYFSSKAKYTFPDLTYQRVFENKIRVEKSADDLYDCNYLMFRNTNFGSKWFYAFINKVTYVNNAASEIEYELDVMQTWYNDYTIDDCFVERMHSTTDAVGDNLIPETIIPTVYVTHSEDAWPKTSMSQGTDLYSPKAILVCSQEPNGYDIYSTVRMTNIDTVNNVPCPVSVHVFDMTTDIQELRLILKSYVDYGPEEAVIGVYAIPPMLDNTTYDTLNLAYSYPTSNFVGGTFDGYTPRNNKLYTYPYNKLSITNSFGQMKEYRFELFNITNNYIQFHCKATAMPVPSLIIYPMNYAGSVQNTDDILSVGDYPEGAVNGDSYMMWVHQGYLDSIASIGGGAVRAVMGFALGDYVGGMIGIGSTVSNIMHHLAGSAKAHQAADQMYGNVKSASAIYGVTEGYSFKFKTKRVIKEQAQMIDDFFTKFGYAQNKIMKPNLHARAHWTYVKTQACTLTGSLPAEDQSKIESIYNKGTTFWVNGDEIGNYSLTNSVLV